MMRPLVALASLAAATGAAHGVLRIEAGEHATAARVVPNGVSGDGVSLNFSRRGLSGTYLAHAVDLRAVGAAVDGQLGATAVSVVLTHAVVVKEIALVVDGRLGDGRVALSISSASIRGVVGPCTYSLGVAGARYQGWRDCAAGAAPVPVTLQLPQLGRDDEAARAALLLVVLAPLEPASALRVSPSPSEQVERRYGLVLEDAPVDAGGDGARVRGVIAGTPADVAGLTEGSIVLWAGREPIHSAAALESALVRLAPGQNLVLQLRQPDQNGWLSLALTAPANAW